MIMNEWVDVNERLPKDRQQVLIAHREGGVMQADFQERWIKSPNGGADHRFNTPYGEESYEAAGDFVEITHWMPLPVSPTAQAPKPTGRRHPPKPLHNPHK